MIQNLSMILGFSKILFKEIGLFFFFEYSNRKSSAWQDRSSFKEPESSRDMVKSRNY